MSSTPNNNWKYLVLGGAAVVASALLFNYFLSSETESSMSKCYEEVEALGPVKKESNGILGFNYYKDLFAIVGRHGRLRFAPEKKKLVEKRRKALKEGKMKEYGEIVKEIIQKEETEMGKLMEDVMESLNITE